MAAGRWSSLCSLLILWRKAVRRQVDLGRRLPKRWNSGEREGSMEQNSQILVAIIMIPVLLEIVLPLAMLAGYGMYVAGRFVFGGGDIEEPAFDGKMHGEKLQPSRA